MELWKTFQDPILTRNIVAVTLNTERGELIAANEDATLIFWNLETGSIVNTVPKAHQGQITGLIFCREQKIILSVSMDNCISVWNSNAVHLQTLKTASPIYSASYSAARNCLVLGQASRVAIYRVHPVEDGVPGDKTIDSIPIENFCHTDIVKCALCYDNRVCSAGFDKKIVIHQLPGSNFDDRKFMTLKKIPNAHDAAITSMTFIPKLDAIYFLTGSYDLTLKLWTIDGQAIATWAGYTSSITSLDFISLIDATMLTDSSGSVTFINSRTGENVANIVGDPFGGAKIKFTSASFGQAGSSASSGGGAKYESLGLVVATTKRNVLVCTSNASASCSNTTIDGFLNCVSCRGDDVIFTGGNQLLQWEISADNPNRMRNRPIEEQKTDKRTEIKSLPSTYTPDKIIRQKRQINLHRRLGDDLRTWEQKWSEVTDSVGWKGTEQKQMALMESTTRKVYEHKQRLLNAKKAASSQKRNVNSFRKKPTTAAGERLHTADRDQNPKEILYCQYYGNKDYLAVSYLSGDIKVFGDEATSQDVDISADNLNDNPDDISGDGIDGGGYRDYKSVVGMTWAVYLEGKHVGGALVLHCFHTKKTDWMISAGYDGSLLIWNMKKLRQQKLAEQHGMFIPTASNSKSSTSNSLEDDKEESKQQPRFKSHAPKQLRFASGPIRRLAFCHETNQIACCSDDSNAYIMDFDMADNAATAAANGTLKKHQFKPVILRHDRAVTSIMWFEHRHIDVSSVEDRNVALTALISFKKGRGLWLTTDISKHMKVWSNNGRKCLSNFTLPHEPSIACLDNANGLILVGYHVGIIQLFKLGLAPDQTAAGKQINNGLIITQVREFRGHMTSITALEVIPGKFYVSTSQDGTLRMWNSVDADIHERQHLLRFTESSSETNNFRSQDFMSQRNLQDDPNNRSWLESSNQNLTSVINAKSQSSSLFTKSKLSMSSLSMEQISEERDIKPRGLGRTKSSDIRNASIRRSHESIIDSLRRQRSQESLTTEPTPSKLNKSNESLPISTDQQQQQPRNQKSNEFQALPSMRRINSRPRMSVRENKIYKSIEEDLEVSLNETKLSTTNTSTAASEMTPRIKITE